MPHGIIKIEYAECPKCGTYAWGEDPIEEVFGYRFEGSKPQSWCRACRKRERMEKNCSYTECPWHGEPDCSSHYDCICNDD